MIVLHIGAHKTGTTSIQRFAAGYRDQLRRNHKLWYPLYQDFALEPKHYAHHEMAHALAGDDEPRLRKAKTFAQSLLAGKHDDEVVLVSAEPIYRHLYPATGDYWCRRLKYAERLRALFPTDDVVVLLVVRRQDGLAKSIYQERVKSGRYSRTFAEFIASEREPFLYNQQASVFAGVFPQVRILVYEDLAAEGLVPAFFRTLGVSTEGLPQAPVENRSLPLPLVEYKRQENLTPLSLKDLAALSERLQGLRTLFPAGLDWIDADANRRFLDSFEVENEELRRTYLPDRSQSLFPPFDPGSMKPVFAGLTRKELSRISKLTQPHALSPLARLVRKIKWGLF